MTRLNRFNLRKAYILCRYTFMDLYKSRILVNCLFLGLGLLLATFVASEFTYGTPQKIALDFGFGAMSISTVVIAIFMGVTLISKEIENRTVYSILARNVSRIEFLIGKLLGLGAILFLNVVILFLLSIFMFVYLGGSFNTLIILATLFVFFEALTTLLIVVFFSLVTNSVLSVLFTIAIYVSSYAIPKAIEHSRNIYPQVSKMLNLIQMILPNFDKANIKNHLLYKEFLSMEFILKNMTVSVCYMLAITLLSIYLFNRKNLN